MSVSIRLKRLGAKKRPYYRIVVANSASPRDGKALEEVGYYHPVEKVRQVYFKANKIKKWLSRGAQVSDTVKRLLNRSQFYLD